VLPVLPLVELDELLDELELLLEDELELLVPVPGTPPQPAITAVNNDTAKTLLM
jgi:hypothetical protein